MNVKLAQTTVIVALLAATSPVAAQSEADAEAALKKLNVFLQRDDKLPGTPVVVVSANGNQRLTDADLKWVSAFKHLRQLDLGLTASPQ